MTVKYNNDRSYDFTNPVLPAGPTSHPQQALLDVNGRQLGPALLSGMPIGPPPEPRADTSAPRARRRGTDALCGGLKEGGANETSLRLAAAGSSGSASLWDPGFPSQGSLGRVGGAVAGARSGGVGGAPGYVGLGGGMGAGGMGSVGMGGFDQGFIGGGMMGGGMAMGGMMGGSVHGRSPVVLVNNLDPERASCTALFNLFRCRPRPRAVCFFSLWARCTRTAPWQRQVR